MLFSLYKAPSYGIKIDINRILLYPHSLLFKEALKPGTNLLYVITNLILANGLDSLD